MLDKLNDSNKTRVVALLDAETEVARRARLSDLPGGDREAITHLEKLIFWGERADTLRRCLGLPVVHGRLKDNSRALLIGLEEKTAVS